MKFNELKEYINEENLRECLDSLTYDTLLADELEDIEFTRTTFGNLNILINHDLELCILIHKYSGFDYIFGFEKVQVFEHTVLVITSDLNYVYTLSNKKLEFDGEMIVELD